MTALDLCPGHPSVFQSDFLKLQIGPRGGQIQVDDTATAGNTGGSTACTAGGADVDPHQGAGRLVSLPGGSFDALVFSLVLSYLPHPMQRTQMMLKARQLLTEPGLLLLVTPHSTDSAPANGARGVQQLGEWRAALEALGFAQVRHEKLHSSHALCFRTIGPLPENPTLLPMPIAFDDQREIILRVKADEESQER
eukprot:CAMPEP_0197853588 /NCGR_PEP_ID=MMETSP1438-20131217/23017_1 /TAXON_ID=1461541 /ORGANISM="Pterosperma sp., Strain CCMP1384" /LENGTH=194 /DNA_ID=CAMNT_0043468057 /DNA_START=9 /DNA_END=593 /DNA_ORIENTATION=-